MKIYAVYKGEEFLFEGTSKECAKYFGVTVDTVRWWRTKANRKRSKGRNRKIAIIIEEV